MPPGKEQMLHDREKMGNEFCRTIWGQVADIVEVCLALLDQVIHIDEKEFVIRVGSGDFADNTIVGFQLQSDILRLPPVLDAEVMGGVIEFPFFESI